MRLTIVTLAALALVGCNKAEAPADTNSADANAAAAPAEFQLTETTWTFNDKDGQAVQETIDANGNYSAVSNGKEIDRGTSRMKDGKACFTSTMDKSGETCWTAQPVAIGSTMNTTSDKGEKLAVMRVDYVAPTNVPAQ